jgi:8-oxo-dGTP diphosphatase
MIAEKAYEGSNHWLMFLFDSQLAVPELPEAIAEGRFSFFSREQIDSLPIPETDRQGLWAIYDNYRDSFVSARANCEPVQPLEIVVEQVIEGSEGRS